MGVVTSKERAHLRLLAEKQREYANLPIMKEREKLWYRHNALEGPRPMIVVEEATFLPEIIPPLQCESEEARWIEKRLYEKLLPYETFDDDKVVPPYFTIPVVIEVVPWGHTLQITTAEEGLGFHVEPLLTHLEDGFSILKPSIRTYRHDITMQRKQLAEEILGDILPIKLINERNQWIGALAKDAVDIMGMENLLFAILDSPDTFHELMTFLTDDIIEEFRWQEENNLVFFNNGNDYVGSGSFCFNKELNPTGNPARVKDTWGHINSQETVGISPSMYHTFFFPHFYRLAEEFGLLYYGCCEAVDAFWESIRQYPNLRKVSISPWCKEEAMAENLTGSQIIYSRKPSPNFLGIQKELDEDAFCSAIEKTHKLTRNRCKTEYIFRDVYKLHGNIEKVRRVVELTRKITES